MYEETNKTPRIGCYIVAMKVAGFERTQKIL